MKNYINISISAKDCDNDQLLLIINKFSDNSVYLKLFNITENKLVDATEIENQRILNIINAFLAEAKEDEYDLENSEYGELYFNFVNLIFHYISSAYFHATLCYEEIKLINLKEY